METVYSTSARSTAGREGTAALTDGTFEVALALPGSGKAGHNPEQLFAMGYAACFDSAAKMVARRLHLPLESSETETTVGLAKDGESFRLVVTVGLRTKGLSPEQSEQLLAEAHKVCPYSNALRGNADVSITLLG